jgi:hypothetical protein
MFELFLFILAFVSIFATLYITSLLILAVVLVADATHQTVEQRVRVRKGYVKKDKKVLDK